MRHCLLLLAVLLVTIASAQKTVSREEYIARYAPLAIADMQKYGIPASIKMAQGLLESDNGNSRLAVIGNNHFGIKCKSTWRGETIDHDDDAPGECFRQYATAEESWDDHARFLSESDRYNSLWMLGPKDYKAWARGLKAAGYATNPRYPEMLVKIIEDNELWRLDEGVVPGSHGDTEPGHAEMAAAKVVEPAAADTLPKKAALAHPNVTPKGGIDPDNFTVKL